MHVVVIRGVIGQVRQTGRRSERLAYVALMRSSLDSGGRPVFRAPKKHRGWKHGGGGGGVTRVEDAEHGRYARALFLCTRLPPGTPDDSSPRLPSSANEPQPLDSRLLGVSYVLQQNKTCLSKSQLLSMTAVHALSLRLPAGLPACLPAGLRKLHP